MADVPGTSVTVVALNTLIWYKNNNNTASLPDTDRAGLDPDDQFTWANTLLAALAEKGRRVSAGSLPLMRG